MCMFLDALTRLYTYHRTPHPVEDQNPTHKMEHHYKCVSSFPSPAIRHSIWSVWIQQHNHLILTTDNHMIVFDFTFHSRKPRKISNNMIPISFFSHTPFPSMSAVDISPPRRVYFPPLWWLGALRSPLWPRSIKRATVSVVSGAKRPLPSPYRVQSLSEHKKHMR